MTVIRYHVAKTTAWCGSFRPLSAIFSVMAQSIIMGALVERASEIRGHIAVLEGQIAKHRADLAHVEATARMFDPSYDGKRVRPKRPAPPRSTYFAMGEISERCRNALREATVPISADDVAVQAMRDKGLDLADRKIRSDMIARLIWALHRLAKAGQAERIGHGLGARWTLAGPP